jgi:hypothetical protein
MSPLLIVPPEPPETIRVSDCVGDTNDEKLRTALRWAETRKRPPVIILDVSPVTWPEDPHA